MKLSPCGLPDDQFIEIFLEKAKFLGRLLTVFHPGTRQIMEEKIAWEMFQECVYAAEAEAQKIMDPEGKNDPFGTAVFASRQDMMDEIKTINDKIDKLYTHVIDLANKTKDAIQQLND
jgi:hypothetical protein